MTGCIATAIHKIVSIIFLYSNYRERYRTCIQFQIHLSWKHLPLVRSTSACRAPLGGEVGASSAQPNDEWPCPAREGLAVWEPRRHLLNRRQTNMEEFLQTSIKYLWRMCTLSSSILTYLEILVFAALTDSVWRWLHPQNSSWKSAAAVCWCALFGKEFQPPPLAG